MGVCGHHAPARGRVPGACAAAAAHDRRRRHDGGAHRRCAFHEPSTNLPPTSHEPSSNLPRTFQERIAAVATVSGAGAAWLYGGRNASLGAGVLEERRGAFDAALDALEANASAAGGPFLSGGAFSIDR